MAGDEGCVVEGEGDVGRMATKWRTSLSPSVQKLDKTSPSPSVHRACRVVAEGEGVVEGDEGCV